MWRGLMLSKALEQFLHDVAWPQDLDYLVIDMPPGTGDIQMALARLLPQAEMVVVTTPQQAAQKVAARVADMARRSFMPVVGVIENMSGFTTEDGRHYDLFGNGGGQELADDLGVPLIGQVPLDPFVVEGGDDGRPVVRAHPDSPCRPGLAPPRATHRAGAAGRRRDLHLTHRRARRAAGADDEGNQKSDVRRRASARRRSARTKRLRATASATKGCAQPRAPERPGQHSQARAIPSSREQPRRQLPSQPNPGRRLASGISHVGLSPESSWSALILSVCSSSTTCSIDGW